jgi:flavin reductase (DIM6/NTAB) family NADH-FMN oxidoreductase RutF
MTALKNDPDMVLITSWNEYQISSAIERTVEFGQLFLQETKAWLALFHLLQPHSVG